MKKIYFLVLGALLGGCSTYEPKQHLSEEVYHNFLIDIAPYVIKKPDEFTYEERFAITNKIFYETYLRETGGEITYYSKNDTVIYFFFSHRDHTSLYEHYRGLGGYVKQTDAGNISFLNLLYHTPRLTKEELKKRGYALFNEMVKTGNVDKYIGNKEYVYTPNADFYYNAKRNRWDYTPNSSWKFLEAAKEEAVRINR